MPTTPVPPAPRRADLVDGSTHVNLSSVLDALVRPTPAPRNPLTSLLPLPASPATATASEVEVVEAAPPPPAAPPPQIPYKAAVAAGPIKAEASGPDPWTVFWLLTGAVVVTGGVVAGVRHAAAVDRRIAARERRDDKLIADIVRDEMALKTAKRAAKGSRGRV